MQLDVFSQAEARPVDLRTTQLPELAEAAAQVGTPAHWLTLTLSQVLELRDGLYTDFVARLDEPIHHARRFCRADGDEYGQGGPVARKFYQREYERLVQGQRQLRATIENVFCDNLPFVIDQGKAMLRAQGLSGEEVEESHEFFNEVIQRPASGDLGKPLPVLMQDLAHEYLRRQVAEPGCLISSYD